MAIIKADNPAIEKELRILDALICDNGGGIHSDIVLGGLDGNLSVETKAPMAEDKEIIRLSRGMLLPDDQYEMQVRGDQFIAVYPEICAFSDVQRRIADCIMALYTLTGKAEQHRKGSFLLTMAPYPDLMDRILSGRRITADQRDWRPETERGLTGADLDRYIARTFPKTRILGYNDDIRVLRTSTIMPVIDFLNHHWRGATFTMGLGARRGDLCIANRQPIAGSLECYSFYSMMDVFDTLIRYDFIDIHAPVVRSVSLELPVPDVGRIVINSQPGGYYRGPLSDQLSDLRLYVPQIGLNKESNELTVTHLFIPHGQSPRALRRVLMLLLATIAGENRGRRYYEDWILHAESVILNANIDYYKGLLDHVGRLANASGASFGLDRIGNVCRLQLDKLSDYKFGELSVEPQQAAG